MLDDGLLPKKGRRVRCIACNHVWRQEPEISSLSKSASTIKIPELTVDPRPPAEKRPSRLKWVIFMMLLLSLISLLSFERAYIVKMWPQSEQIYEHLGLQASLPGSGLSIINVTPQVHYDGSVEMVKLSGDIVNTSNRVQTLPPLKIKSLGNNSHPKCLKNQPGSGCVLDYWEQRLSQSPLLPEEHLHFETEPRPKVEGTQHISVEF